MKKIIVFIGALVAVTIVGGGALLASMLYANNGTGSELEKTQEELAAKEIEVATLKKEVEQVHAYTSFLSLAFCPTLEAGNKNSLCMQDGAEWFNQTLKAGAAVSDPTIQASMGALTQSLNSSGKQLSSRQFYELLRPLETRALQAIMLASENK